MVISEEWMTKGYNNLQFGVIITDLSTNFNIYFMNKYASDLIAVHEEELKEVKDLNILFHKKQLGILTTLGLFTILKKNEKISTEIKYLKNGREYKWIGVEASIYVQDKDEDKVFWILTDVTHKRKELEDMELMNAKYKMLMEESVNIIFDIDMKTGDATFINTFYEVLGREPICENFIENVFQSQVIHLEDRYIFKEALHKIKEEKVTVSLECRSLHANGEYIWFYITLKPVLDELGNLIYIVGDMQNIDQRKKEMQELRKRSTFDSLTNIYNKETVKLLVNDDINNRDKREISALFSIDLDNFKAINDNFGHLFGDSVLIEMVNLFKQVFDTNAIIARFGGDEFVVYLHDILSKEYVIQKAQELRDNSVKEFISADGNNVYKVSVSIGIAYVNNEKDFVELYHKADLALLHVKRLGKNQFKIFNDSISLEEEFQEYYITDKNNEYAAALYKTMLEEAFMDANQALNKINTYAAVIDEDTREILYLNKKFLDKVPHAQLGDICYTVLGLQKETICEDCPVSMLTKDVDFANNKKYKESFDITAHVTAVRVPWKNARKAVLVCHNQSK